MEHAYFINLDRDIQKRIDTIKHLSELGIKSERISAIDGSKINKNKFGKLIKSESNLSDAEIGTIISHINAWLRCLKSSNTDRCLIFEDDARTSLNKYQLQGKLDGVIKSNDYDILYLGKCGDHCTRYKKTDFDGVYQSFHPICAHAYVITKKAISKILENFPTSDPIDIVIMNLIEAKKIKAYVFHPSLFSQDVLNYTSNLRSKKVAMQNIVECSDHLQGIEYESTKNFFNKISPIVLIVILILILIWIMRSKKI